MRSVLLVAFFALAVGCEQPMGVDQPPREAKVIADSREVQLPTAIAAKARSFSDDHVLVLNVNRVGQIALASAIVRPGDYGLIKTQAEAITFFQSRAKEDREAAGAQALDKPLRSVILRIDALTPFEHTSAVLTAARQVGYVNFRLRTQQPDAAIEGEFELGRPTTQDGASPPLRSTVSVTADDAGRIANLTFRGTPPLAKPDHGTDLVALLDTVNATARAAERTREVYSLAIEADPRLLHVHLVQVIDIGTRAGFRVMWPSLLDANKQ